ncbi:Uncharacterised protein [Chryseobacterium nakagawai]|uniref:Uncharacterized protein n=1 Tax=Chryseobacterium nakagawai TaxID=1241982 RepID=A0AAD0YKT8_CHRNA|nr:hypothetical protein [Chryseobacterium nakagawai]AZA90283.1 hypothetical protein EG343_06460 [Chryseobacterium nakagawai]VEH21761.1 Uncharacterised protein [Chryseobacterium nakagawai]
MINEAFNLLFKIVDKFFEPKSSLKKTEELEKLFTIIRENHLENQKEIAEEKLFELQTGIKTNLAFAQKLKAFKEYVGGKYDWSVYRKIFLYLQENEQGKIIVNITKYQEYTANALMYFTLFIFGGGFITILLIESFIPKNIYHIIIFLYIVVSLFFLFLIYLISNDYLAMQVKKQVKKIEANRESQNDQI